MNKFLVVSSEKESDIYDFSYILKNDSLRFCVNNREIISESENFIAVFDGEFFNRHTLLSLVEKEFYSNSSLLIKLFEKYAYECFELAEGNFSAIIYDKREKRLIFASDITGTKPLYYASLGKTFLLCDSLKNIFASSSTQKEIDPDSLCIYFRYGFILRPRTIYKNCNKVPASSHFTYDLRTGNLKRFGYWSLANCYDYPKTDETEEVITANAKKLLIDSVRKRVPAGNSTGAFLSGGYDSGTICAILKKELDIDVETFTIGFEEKSINEAAYAKEVASYLGIRHTEYYFRDSDAKDILLSLSDIYEQPFADYGASPTVMLAKIAASKGISTLFGGDGGDEIFATADDAEAIEKIMSLPRIVKSSLFHLLNNIPVSLIKDIKYYNPLMTRYEKLLSLLQAPDIARIIKLRMTLFTDNALTQLLNTEFKNTSGGFENITFGKYAQTIDQITGVYFKTFLSDAEIVKSANALDFYDISLRNPFLDKDLISYMATVPAHLKIKNKTRKNILKNITHSYIPKELLDRPKMGFDIPFDKWLRGELYDMMMDLTTREYIKRGGILNYEEVGNIKNRFLSGDDRYKYKLWSIFIFQLWYRRNYG